MRERTVIFATDLRRGVAQGLRLATQLAAQHAATLLVMHVVPLHTSDGETALYADLRHATPQAQRRLAAIVPDDPSVPYRHLRRTGSPLDEITAAVEREDAAWLVMSAQPRSLWQRLRGPGLLQQLQCQVACPVVTYRPHANPRLRLPSPQRPPSPSPADTLQALLDARTEALLGWLAMQRDAVLALAHQRSTRDSVAALVRGRRWRLNPRSVDRVEAALIVELEEHRRALGALGVEVRSPHSPLPILQLGRSACSDTAHQRWLQRLYAQGAGVSLPMESSSPNSDGVIQTGACIPQPDAPRAALIFTLDARRSFLRILAQPGPTPSAETYAFDRDGMMLSYSRFPDQLRAVGLLPAEPGVQTPRKLRLCDPGGNLLRGEGATHTALPLTRMAAAATSGQDGHDWHGYRDYRGVSVIGAWRWLPEYDFGVAAEMDAEPARPRTG